jgi:hypothetical protein
MCCACTAGTKLSRSLSFRANPTFLWPPIGEISHPGPECLHKLCPPVRREKRASRLHRGCFEGFLHELIGRVKRGTWPTRVRDDCVQHPVPCSFVARLWQILKRRLATQWRRPAQLPSNSPGRVRSRWSGKGRLQTPRNRGSPAAQNRRRACVENGLVK